MLEMCYVYVESENQVGIVKWGESGYCKTNLEAIDDKKKFVDEMNEHYFGINKLESEAMKICSMCNGLKVEKWEEHYNFVLNRLREKVAKENE